MLSKRKICVVATVPVAIKVFMREHILRLSEKYSVVVVCSGDTAELANIFAGFDVRCVSINIERKVSFFNDLNSLIKLQHFFVNERFDAVHSLMPKSGLLAMLGAKLARVPVRIHIFTGQVWSTNTGLKRMVLKAMDWLLARCATQLLADSPSQRDFLVSERVVAYDKISVLGLGSISGVDSSRFKSDVDARLNIRRELSVPSDAVVFLFMARITKAKGAVDMVQAFKKMADLAPLAHLLMIGPDEDGLDSELELNLGNVRERYIRVGFTDQPEQFMAAADIFCLPSYREGFSSATIQAAGAGLPAVASRIYGLSDAVVEGVTGLMHAPGDIPEIARCMLRLYSEPSFREELSLAAQKRAHDSFSQDIIVGEMVKFYEALVP